VSRYRREVAALRRNVAGAASRNSKPTPLVAPPSMARPSGPKPGATTPESAVRTQKRAKNTHKEANHP
jgi:hypothetical protein